MWPPRPTGGTPKDLAAGAGMWPVFSSFDGDCTEAMEPFFAILG
jgi:hypothetical protein